MKCHVCEAISKVVYYSGLEFCEAYGLNSFDFKHNQQKVYKFEAPSLEGDRMMSNIENGKNIFHSIDDAKSQMAKDGLFLEGHLEVVRAIAVTSDNTLIISGSGDATVRIWNLKTRRQEAVLKGHSDVVRSVTVTSDNNLIVSGGCDSTVRIWNLKTRLQ